MAWQRSIVCGIKFMRIIRPAALLLFALTLPACNTLGLSAAPPPAPAAPAPPPAPSETPIAGVLAGPLAADVAEGDRRAAFVAQLDALDKGLRKSWRGPRTFGFIEPGPEAARADGVCRDYAMTFYVQGRPRTGKGTACRQSNGSWRFTA